MDNKEKLDECADELDESYDAYDEDWYLDEEFLRDCGLESWYWEHGIFGEDID